MEKIFLGNEPKAFFKKEFSGVCSGVKRIKEDVDRGDLIVISLEEDNVLIFGQSLQGAVVPGKSTKRGDFLSFADLEGKTIAFRKGQMTITEVI